MAIMIEVNSLKMKLFVVGCVFISYFVHVLVANRKGCSFFIHGENEKYSPILLQSETNFVLPKNGIVNLHSREFITLICPDPKNYLIGFNTNMTDAQCIDGKVLRVNDDDVNFDKLECKKIIRGVVSKTNRKCGNNEGRIYKIGYPMSSRFFTTLIESCYDYNLSSTLYTQHLLHGEDIRYASKSSYRPSFSPEGAADSVSVAYKQVFQKSTFNKLLKSAKTAEDYIHKSSYLARGHLSPDADFIFAATQYTTYYYINAVPQWQAVNAGNWRRIEGLVRKVADHLRESLVIITGAHKVLILPDINNQPTEIYLISGKKLPVPKFLWKIVYSKKLKRAIVLITLNNPFLKYSNENYLLCNNICNKSGWNSEYWNDYERGLVHCCDYGEFVAEVETAPKLEVVGVLQGPK